MKKLNFLLAISWFALIGSCSKEKASYDPASCLSGEKQSKLIQEMVRYASKLPPEATHETKFSPEFNWYYNKAAAESRILYCHVDVQDSSFYLLVARQARSITPMEEGIALKIKFDNKGAFDTYEEVFRMWKMPADTLSTRGRFLFDQMVMGKDLSLYYSKFQRDRFIEFPDDRFTFDKEARKWRDRELDSLDFN